MSFLHLNEQAAAITLISHAYGFITQVRHNSKNNSKSLWNSRCYTLRKKGFFNGSSVWSKGQPDPFCYLNQAKGSPKYTQLWRTLNGSSFSCEKPLKVRHALTKNTWWFFTIKDPTLSILGFWTSFANIPA